MFLQALGWHSHSKENKDSVQDALLLMYLLKKTGNRVSGQNKLLAQIKLMKLVFLTEKTMVEMGFKGFNFFFNIFKRGPSSHELLRMVDDLITRGLINYSEENTFTLTEAGQETIDDFIESTSEINSVFFKVIDNIVDEYGDLTPEQILERVYAMEVTPMHSNQAINIGEEVRKSSRKRLLMKMDGSGVKKELSISENWLETMNLVLNPEFSR